MLEKAFVKKVTKQLISVLLILLLVSLVSSNVTDAAYILNDKTLTTDEAVNEEEDEQHNEESKQDEQIDELEREFKAEDNQLQSDQAEPEENDGNKTVLARKEKDFERNPKVQDDQHKQGEEKSQNNNLSDKALGFVKRLVETTSSMFQLTSSEPEYVMATDDDFSGTKNGEFRYIGNDEYVEIPHVIKGVNVTSYFGMFQYTNVKGVKSTNPNVTDMSNMFLNHSANELDLSQLDTSGVKYMRKMFYGNKSTKIDLSNFDTSNVTSMNGMFYSSNVRELDLSSFDTSNVTDMEGMFAGLLVPNIDLSNFDTSNVTNMKKCFMVPKSTC